MDLCADHKRHIGVTPLSWSARTKKQAKRLCYKFLIALKMELNGILLFPFVLLLQLIVLLFELLGQIIFLVRRSPTSVQIKPNVVIIGGGFSGLAAARKLESKFRVTVIDRKNYFEYTPGILPSFVNPNLLRTLDFQYKYLKKTFLYRKVKFVQGNVKSIQKSFVTLDNGDKVDYDYLVIAWGCGYNDPILPRESTKQERKNTAVKFHNALKKASKICIVGGGAVGVELSAEIVTNFPSKKVQLFSGSPKLLEHFPSKVSKHSEHFLKSRGVEIIQSRVTEHTPTSVKTLDGQTYECDEVILCTGIQRISHLKWNPSDLFSYDVSHLVSQTIPVNSHFQVQGYKNIFAIGDVKADATREMKLAFVAELNGSFVAKNIKQLHEESELSSYPVSFVGAYSNPLISVISLGAYDGILIFNNVVLTGVTAAFGKSFVEWSKCLHIRGKVLGFLIWEIGEPAALW